MSEMCDSSEEGPMLKQALSMSPPPLHTTTLHCESLPQPRKTAESSSQTGATLQSTPQHFCRVDDELQMCSSPK